MLLCARYVLPISGDPIEDGAVLVRNGRIADIGPASSLKIRYTDVPVKDFGLAALLPGLVDLHTHLEYAAFRGTQNDLPYMEWAAAGARNAARMSRADWDAAALFGGLEALSAGITCVADITGTGASLRAALKLGLRGVFYREVGATERSRIARAMQEAEDDILAWLDEADSAEGAGTADARVEGGRAPETPETPETPHAAQAPETAQAAQAAHVAQAARAVRDSARSTAPGATALAAPGTAAPAAPAPASASRITVGVAADHLYRCHPAVFGEVAKLASRENMPVALHLAESREEHDFVKYGSSDFAVHMGRRSGYIKTPPWLPTGTSPVVYALNWGAFDVPNVLAVHCVCVDDNDIAVLRKHGVSVAVCARSNAGLGKGVAPLQSFLKAGLRVGLGTDSPAATDSTDLFQEQRTALLLERARGGREFLDSSTVLRMATLGGAEALGLDDRIGSLETGKCADIIAVDLAGTLLSGALDPVSALVNTCSGTDVLMTMVDGRMLYEKDAWHVDADVAGGVAHMIGVRAKLKD